MSERGSFVTQYIYCNECFVRMRAVLEQRGKQLCGIAIPSWEEEQSRPLPILAGKVGGSYPGQELTTFVFDLFDKSNAPCHPVRIAVLSDDEDSQSIIEVRPDGEVSIKLSLLQWIERA